MNFARIQNDNRDLPEINNLNLVNGKEPFEVNRNQQADSDPAKLQLEKKHHSLKYIAGQIHDMELHRKKSALFNLKKRPFA